MRGIYKNQVQNQLQKKGDRKKQNPVYHTGMLRNQLSWNRMNTGKSEAFVLLSSNVIPG